jgi:hypothetical protein
MTYESSRKGRNLVIICVVSFENTVISSCGWLEDRLSELPPAMEFGLDSRTADPDQIARTASRFLKG